MQIKSEFIVREKTTSTFKLGVIFYLKVPDQYKSICCRNAARKQKAESKIRIKGLYFFHP